MSGTPTDLDKLAKLDEAIDDSILDATEADLREDLAEAGDSFEEAVTRAGRALQQAKQNAARLRFKRAQDELRTYRAQENVTVLDIEKSRRKLDGMRSGEVAGALLAARKGGKLSVRDEENLLKDLAQLEAFENDQQEGKE